jgi:hypothetical protein
VADYRHHVNIIKLSTTVIASAGHGQMQYTASGPASQTGGATSAGQLQQEEEVVVDQSDLDVEDSFSGMAVGHAGVIDAVNDCHNGL